MPKHHFTFYIDNDNKFESFLESKQCTGICKNGNQCRKIVVLGLPYCYVHLLSQKHLRIKKSTIEGAGNGLFSMDTKKGENDIIFKKDEIIGAYTGEILNRDQLDERYGEDNTAPYALQISNNKYVDASIQRCFMSICNHGNNTKANARFVNSVSRGGITPNYLIIRATKPIRNNCEILINYGKEYKFEYNHETKLKR